MIFQSLTKLVSHSLIKAAGLGVSTLAVLVILQVAKAADRVKGFDYFLTPGDGTSSIVLPNIGIVPLVGTPFAPAASLADTKLE